MQITSLVAALSLLSVSALGNPIPWGPTKGWPHPYPGGYANPKALYFLRVDPAGSTIEAVALSNDGLTDSTSSTSTGGVGLQSVQFLSPSLAPVVADPLQGQQGVSTGDDYLFTINSGSNTAVVFAIDPKDPLKLSLIGKPVSTLGQFPMSITYSSKFKKACALNGGAVNGVTCYNVGPKEGLIPDGVGLRNFDISALTPGQLLGPKGSGSNIIFTPDSSKVLVSFKGETKLDNPIPATGLPVTPTAPAHFIVLDVSESGAVAATFTDNRVPPFALTFGIAVDLNRPTNIYASDVFGGGGLVNLDYATDKISVEAIVNTTAFGASCWSVYVQDLDVFVDINSVTPNLGIVNAETGVLERTINYDASLMGGFDSVVIGTKLVILTSVNKIAVIDLVSGATLQEESYLTADDRPFWTGLATWPGNPALYGGL